MNNLIKSEWFMLTKKGRITSVLCLMVGYASVFFGGFLDGKHIFNPFSAQALGSGSTCGIMIVTMIASAAISVGYLNRTRIYEIMSGFAASQILLGRTVFYAALLTALYLVPVSVVMLIIDNSAKMVLTLILFCILFIRFLLCTIFLSPLFKEGAWITSLSYLIVLIMPAGTELDGSSAGFGNSVCGFTTFGQCVLLSEPLTSDFAVKVVISSVVSCAICYLIGYFTLKKKFDLEPHPLE